MTAERFYPDLYILNSSRLPVYDVQLYLWVSFDGRPIVWQSRPTLPPMDQPLVASTYLDANDIERSVMEHTIGVTLCFKDAEGTCWQRTRRGQLVRIEDPRYPDAVAEDANFSHAILMEDVSLPRTGDPPTGPGESFEIM